MVALSQQDKTTKITPPAKTNGGHCEIGLALILKKISSFSKPVWNGFQTISARLAWDFSLVWDFWLCSRQYFRLLSCSRFMLLDFINLLYLLWDSFRLIQTQSDSFRLNQTQSDSFRLNQTHSDSFSLIEPHWDSWRRIRRILRKRTLLARMMGMMMRLKSHFLKRCSLSERLKSISSEFYFSRVKV